MKDLLKIYLRYILTAASICIIIIVFNGLLFSGFLFLLFGYKTKPGYGEWNVARLSASLISQETAAPGKTDAGQYPEDGNPLPSGNISYALSEEARQEIDKNYAFAMLIGQDGQVVWSRNLPEEIPLTFSLTDVASFTRWYLKDYSVTVWEHPDGLFVVADPKGLVWKHAMLFPVSFIRTTPLYLAAALVFNLLLIFLLAILFGHRLYRSLKPLAQGIENLNGREILHLPESGLVGGLARKLNQASAVLMTSLKALEKRDNARTSWIAGVSHDIRTPLSLIMGHADNLEHVPRLTPEEQKEAASIKEHSLQIKKLIEDLNLTSKLEYDSYPLRLQEYSPAALLRELAAYYINDIIREPYTFSSQIDTAVESLRLVGDTALLQRALRNLLDNSVRHNPQGCEIFLLTESTLEAVKISVSDTGCGIPVRIIRDLYREASHKNPAALSEPSQENPKNVQPPVRDRADSLRHGLGLRIVKQIVEAHEGRLEFHMQKELCHTVILWLPKAFKGPSRC